MNIEDLWTASESIAHANFALNNSLKLIQRMIKKGLIDGNIEIGVKHTMSLNDIVDQMRHQIKRSNEASNKIKINLLKDEDN